MTRPSLCVLAFASLALPAGAWAQQGAPAVVWPDPPQAQQQPAPAAPARTPAARKPAQPKPAQAAQPAAQPQGAPGSIMQEEPAPKPKAAARPAGRRAAGQDIRCDGPFARDGSHDKLAAAFGAGNVTVQDGASVLFANDPTRRLEITWHDAAARRRPAAITVEGVSNWRARGFRVGEPLAAVEKANRKPFRLAGFAGDHSGAARDWQGGALDKLSGGCLLGVRFVPDAGTPQEARTTVATEGEFLSDAAEIRAVKPTIVELIVGYPQ